MRAMLTAALCAIGAAAIPAALHAEDETPRAKPIGNPGDWVAAYGYPPAARASQEEGRVAFTLDVDETGHASECKVTTSSESPLLDETTCNLMIANGRFEPPRNKKNKPIASKWSSSVRWKLDAPLPAAASTSAVAAPPPAVVAPVAPVKPVAPKTAPTKRKPAK